jgi:hypothetical protein
MLKEENDNPLWQILKIDPAYEIHVRSTKIRNIKTHEPPEYIVESSRLLVILSGKAYVYQSVIRAQIIEHPEIVVMLLIKKELRENLKVPNRGSSLYKHRWVPLIANSNYKFNIETLTIKHVKTFHVPSIVKHDGYYCLVLDNTFYPYVDVFIQQFLTYPEAMFGYETEELIDDLAEERTNKIEGMEDDDFLFSISSPD